MEKRCSSRTAAAVGLLIACFACIRPLFCVSADNDNPPSVTVTLSAAECHVGEPVTLEISVLYPNIHDVSITLSDLPSGISCSEMRYERRPVAGVPDARGSQMLVRSCVLRCLYSGAFPLGVVSVAAGAYHSEHVLPVLYCSDRTARSSMVFCWGNPPEYAAAGVPFVLNVYAQHVPHRAVLSWATSDGLYVEQIPPQNEAFSSFRVTPLDAGTFMYPSVTLSWEKDGQSYSRTLPQLSFSAAPQTTTCAAPQTTACAAPQTTTCAAPQTTTCAAPQTTMIQNAFNAPQQTTPDTDNSKQSSELSKAQYSARRNLIVSLFFCIGLCVAVFRCKRRAKNVVLCLCIAALCCAGVCGVRCIKLRSGLVAMTDRLYFIPDADNGTYAYIAPGTLLEKKKETGLWFYVKTADGKTGWIPADNVHIQEK